MCKIFSISNQKGGVGKTTTTINLGVALGKMGKKVLLVDLDPQANLTMSLGFPQPDEIEMNVVELLKQKMLEKSGKESNIKINKDDYLISTQGINFIPSSIELAALENTLVNTMSRENVLKDVLEIFKEDYDYILIDCLPSLNILTVNSLNACDEVLIPVQAQYLSAKGLELLLQTISSVKTNLNHSLEICGVLITMLDKRANFQKDVINIIQNSYGEHVRIFENMIPLSVKVSETQSKGLSVIEEKNNKVALGYQSFARELVGCE